MSISTIILSRAWFFLLLLFGYSMTASNRRCLPLEEGGSFCFTQPDPPMALSWSSAMQWCKSINATLPILNTSYHYSVYQDALSYFGLQAETLWLGANATYDPNNWYWIDGSRFTGTVEERNSQGNTHAYIARNGTEFKFGAANPFDRNYYICRVSYSERDCTSSLNTIWANGKCFYKYSNSYYSRRSWYSAVSSCGLPNLPSYDDLTELSRWLDNLSQFWIGLRSGWWTWRDFVTGRSFEWIQNDFGGTLANIGYGQCLASYSNSDRSTNWINMNCNRTLQFVCQEHVTAVMAPTTTKTPVSAFQIKATLKTFPSVPVHKPSVNIVAVKAGCSCGGALVLGLLIFWSWRWYHYGSLSFNVRSVARGTPDTGIRSRGRPMHEVVV